MADTPVPKYLKSKKTGELFLYNEALAKRTDMEPTNETPPLPVARGSSGHAISSPNAGAVPSVTPSPDLALLARIETLEQRVYSLEQRVTAVQQAPRGDDTKTPRRRRPLADDATKAQEKLVPPSPTLDPVAFLEQVAANAQAANG